MTFLLSPYPESPLLPTLSESPRSTTPRNTALARDSEGFCYFCFFLSISLAGDVSTAIGIG